MGIIIYMYQESTFWNCKTFSGTSCLCLALYFELVLPELLNLPSVFILLGSRDQSRKLIPAKFRKEEWMVKVVVICVSSFAILFIHYTSFSYIGHQFPFFGGLSKFLVRLFLLTCNIWYVGCRVSLSRPACVHFLAAASIIAFVTPLLLPNLFAS